VLADRLAAALVHHEPGWRLPRHTALARRYNVSTAQIDAALGELVVRHLIRRLPDGQLYRVSPAECLIPLAGTLRLASHIDPMGGKIACRSRQVSWRRVPEDVGRALGVPPGDSACVVRLLWTSDGEPAALATTYLARHLAGKPAAQGDEPLSVPPAVLAALPLFAVPGMDAGPAGFLGPGADGGTAGSGAPDADSEPAGAAADAGEPGAAACQPRALFVELQPPPPAVARSLRLSAGQPAAMVTVRFDEPAGGRAAALTVAVLRPDMFRIVVESPASRSPDGTVGSFSGAWTYALQDWEP
jgi:UTRA domain